jgi:hypothetical protein
MLQQVRLVWSDGNGPDAQVVFIFRWQAGGRLRWPVASLFINTPQRVVCATTGGLPLGRDCSLLWASALTPAHGKPR